MTSLIKSLLQFSKLLFQPIEGDKGKKAKVPVSDVVGKRNETWGAMSRRCSRHLQFDFFVQDLNSFDLRFRAFLRSDPFSFRFLEGFPLIRQGLQHGLPAWVEQVSMLCQLCEYLRSQFIRRTFRGGRWMGEVEFPRDIGMIIRLG